jgi:putative oxidoreductase
MKFFLPVLISMLAAALGIFFIYKGVDKHFINNCSFLEANKNIPENYKNLITALCQSGFMIIVGLIEIIAGLLMIFPKTRFAGVLMILPVITTIFLFHLMIDNRPYELLETGIPFAATLLIFSSHQKNLKLIISPR